MRENSMRKRVTAPRAMVAIAVLLALPLFAADDAALRKDLTAVIALHGLPCGEVVGVVRRGDNDYVASCKDGNRYHVFVNEGRVVVQKQ
jgi:hypothetical protein